MVALIGRRRVGKTHLVKQVFGRLYDFEITGIQHASTATLLANFANKLNQYANPLDPISPPKNWLDAFTLLKQYLLKKETGQKKVVFIDELPWMGTKRSGFLEMLGHFWNDWATHNNVILIICGSAASWMISQVIHHKGSLHNRITSLLHLQPFTLSETEQFLQKNNIELTRYQIVQLYMITGGIPHYLNGIKKGESMAQNIDRLCFAPGGFLKDEFDKLYASLFDKPNHYINLVRALTSKWMGLTRSQILQETGWPDGGSVTRLLNELEQSDFISSIPPFDKKKKDTLYRLTDNYSLFYLKFMEGKRKGEEGIFTALEHTQSWKSWCGYAFENICLTHIKRIKAALGIAAVYTEVTGYLLKGDPNQNGIQIDLLINRADKVINLCEIKFYDAEFIITKQYAAALREKKAIFRENAAKDKSIFITFITCFGVKKNAYANELVQNEVTIDQLFT